MSIMLSTSLSLIYSNLHYIYSVQIPPLLFLFFPPSHSEWIIFGRNLVYEVGPKNRHFLHDVDADSRDPGEEEERKNASHATEAACQNAATYR